MSKIKITYKNGQSIIIDYDDIKNIETVLEPVEYVCIDFILKDIIIDRKTYNIKNLPIDEINRSLKGGYIIKIHNKL